MTMTPDELDACRVFLAAYRKIPHNGRIETIVRDKGSDRARDVQIRIVHTETITASAIIAVHTEAR